MRKVAGWALALLAGVGSGGAAHAQEAKAAWEYGVMLHIDFARSMQNWDNTPAAVRITPALPLACAWASDTRLDCRATKDPRGATPYRVEIPAGLATQSGDTLPLLQLDAPTARPSVTASVREWKAGVPQVELETALTVDTAQLARRLVVAIDGAPVTVRLEALERKFGTLHRIVLPAKFAAGRGQLSVRMRPGLVSSEGPLPGVQDEVLLKAPLNPPAALVGLDCSHRGEAVAADTRAGRLVATCSPSERVELIFSQPLDEVARQQVTALLQAGLRADDGRAIEPLKIGPIWSARAGSGIERLPAEGRFWLATEDHATTLRARLDGAVRTQGIALDPVELELHWDQARPQVRAPVAEVLVADAARAPRPEAINAPGATYLVRGVAADAGEESVRVPADATDDRARGVSSPLTQRLLAQGGWASWQRAGKAGPSRWRTLQFAAPGFDLATLVGRRELLAWANAWEGDAPVAGAELELLLREPVDAPLRVVARATTAADGAALLRLPDDLVLPALNYAEKDDSRPRWLLRATHGGKRSVLPLADASQLGTALERTAWGVTDRPLYRAGDVVRYRLWQRQVQARRLVALPAQSVTPLPLYLVDADGRGRPLLEWRQAPAADGGVHGDIRLPEHLGDGLHCIQVDASADEQGACFYVGSFRAQDLWVEVKTPGGVVRDGDALRVQVAAGYYSGGPAVGAAPEPEVDVQPVDFAQAYPAWSDYSFLDPEAEEDAAALDVPDTLPALDAAGQASGSWPLRFEDDEERPAFGRIEASVEVAPQDRDATSGTDQATLYARFDRYVGLRTDPEWFDSDDAVRAQGVVVDASGQEVKGAPVEVTIERVESDDDETTTVVGRCTLHARAAERCDFPRTHSGIYRLTARSGNAAPAVLERYVWTQGADDVTDELDPALDVQDASPARDRPLRLRLTQPLSRARALLAITAGDAILGHRVQAIDGPVQAIDLPLDPAWRQRLDVIALVRATPPAPRDDGRRSPASVERVDARIPAATRTPSPGVALTLAPARAAPGQTVTLSVGNPGAVARTVTVAVVDDALRAQAQKFLYLSQPQQWLDRAGGSHFYLNSFGFDTWERNGPWRDYLPWPDAGARPQNLPRASFVGDNYSSNYSGQYSESDATTLDRIEVTGSRIRQSQVEVASPIMIMSRASARPSPTAPREHGNASASALGGEWRVRGAFADTAFWLADLRLAPGETRSVAVTLPDNLTRWKAVAWSADADDGFAMDEAALESGLPVETRLQVPVRVYPGDVARLAASVRQLAGTRTQAQTALSVRRPGAGDPARVESGELSLAAAGQASTATVVAPQAPGAIDVIAYAQTRAGRDAVGARVEVASPWIAARKVQAGWLGESARELPLPMLPPGATDAHLEVSVLRGHAGLAHQWTRDLRDYPHRCWEQILSRAVGAALALERGDTDWPQAREAIDEALRNAAVFQNGDGGFRYFTEERNGYATADPAVPLSAWSVRALELLQSMGHAVPAAVLERGRGYLAAYGMREATQSTAKEPGPADLTRLAYVAAARPTGDDTSQPKADDDDEAEAVAGRAERRAQQLDRLWQRWSELPLPGRIAAATALARGGHPAARAAVSQLLALAPVRGETRVLAMPQRFDEWMSSHLREQCALIDLLGLHPALADPRARRELQRGLGDLYAGGVASVDTQTAAVCLAALRDTQAPTRTAAAVDVAVGAQTQRLLLSPQQDSAQWTAAAPASPLRLSGVPDQTPLSYVATLAYQEDARTAQAAAVGFRLARRYDVLRNGEWRALDGAALRDGDWVRISLELDTAAPRHFVAITDEVPGGLRPTDLELSGVATAQVTRIGDTGSEAFQTRRLDPRRPRFYATYLPAGAHVVHYFARVGNGGDYLAAPAVAELMYGEATRARTAADRVRIRMPDARAP